MGDVTETCDEAFFFLLMPVHVRASPLTSASILLTILEFGGVTGWHVAGCGVAHDFVLLGTCISLAVRQSSLHLASIADPPPRSWW